MTFRKPTGCEKSRRKLEDRSLTHTSEPPKPEVLSTKPIKSEAQAKPAVKTEPFVPKPEPFKTVKPKVEQPEVKQESKPLVVKPEPPKPFEFPKVTKPVKTELKPEEPPKLEPKARSERSTSLVFHKEVPTSPKEEKVPVNRAPREGEKAKDVKAEVKLEDSPKPKPLAEQLAFFEPQRPRKQYPMRKSSEENNPHHNSKLHQSFGIVMWIVFF